MKKYNLIIAFVALVLSSCGGGGNNQGSNTTTAPTQPNPYDVDNLNGKYVDCSKPILITSQYNENPEASQFICEYCRYDTLGRIIEYGCQTSQYDYDTYIRMFKIYYNSNKIDSIQGKEIISELVDKKIDQIFKKGVSIFDIVNDENPIQFPTDTVVKNLDPYSIASMRQYADSKSDILYRQYGEMYDFSAIQKWNKEQRDNQGRLTSSEYKEDLGNNEYEQYKIDYTYGDDFVKRKIHHKTHTLDEGDGNGFYDWESDFIQTEKYLHTNTSPEIK